MDGQSLNFHLNQVLSEGSSSIWTNMRSSYAYLYEAAKKFAARVKTLTYTDTITTVANQARYDFNSDFANLYFRDSYNRFVIQYTDSSNNVTWIPYRTYDAMRQANNTTSVTIPSNFSISDKQALTSRISANATANGVISNMSECTLYDTTTTTTFANAVVGDDVHNITQSLSGIVIEKSSNTALVTALFDSDGNSTSSCQWTAADTYVIVPQGLKQLILDPPPSASGDTISIEYLQEPPPVYSPYRTYRFDQQYEMGIVYYAAWLYKYKDKQPDFADRWFKAWDEMVRRALKEANKQLQRGAFRVNLRTRSYRDRSYR